MTQTSKKDTFLTNKDLQEIFHCSDGTIRNWTRRGRLNPIKIEGKVFYRPDDIRTLCATYSADRIAQPQQIEYRQIKD